MAKTILLADDSVTIQKVVELTFMDQDYQVVATGNGTSALEQLAELGPDLVIADVHMPGADGYEVCRQTKDTVIRTSRSCCWSALSNSSMKRRRRRSGR